jgi:phosphoribosylglycinamide formyltransferase 1
MSPDGVRIGWLSTGRDPAAHALLAETVARARRDDLPLDIGVVFSDRERGEGEQSDRLLDLADSLGFATATLSSRRTWQEWWSVDTTPGHGEGQHKSDVRQAWRDDYHRQVVAILEPYDLDLLVLAGYMLITSEAMCRRYAMVNLHPALPGGPTGTWQEVIWELLRSDAHETGAMIHLATHVLDHGPVVAYCGFPIVGGQFDPLWLQFRRKRDRRGLGAISIDEGESEPLFAEIRRQGERREIPLLYRTVRQFAESSLRVVDGDVVAATGELPLDLTAAVDDELRLADRG